MESIKCPNCGGSLIIGPDAEFGLCASCGSEVPLPRLDVGSMTKYSRANELLSQSQFSDAQRVFDLILDENPRDAAACWGRALAEYGVEYVHDPVTDELLPTLHRLSVARFSQYIYARQAQQYAASSEAEAFYTRQMEQIDRIQQKSLEISSHEEPYDIFICYKRTEADETRTPDSRLAGDLYRELVKRGYKVFFAEETLTAGVEYEPRIMAALHSARTMIAVATKPEYYEAVWVKNEWERYLELMERESQDGGVAGKRMLIPMFQHMALSELPPTLQNMPNYVDMDNLVNPKQQLLQLISRHFGSGGQAAADTRNIRRSVERTAQRDGSKLEVSAENFCSRGMVSLSSENYSGAEIFFRKALEMDENCVRAHWGLILCDLRIPGEAAVADSGQDIAAHAGFKRIVELAGNEELTHYLELSDAAAANKSHLMENARRVEECEAKMEEVVKDFARSSFSSQAFEPVASIVEWIDFCRWIASGNTAERLIMVKKLRWKLLVFSLLGLIVPGIVFTCFPDQGQAVENIGYVCGILGFCIGGYAVLDLVNGGGIYTLLKWGVTVILMPNIVTLAIFKDMQPPQTLFLAGGGVLGLIIYGAAFPRERKALKTIRSADVKSKEMESGLADAAAALNGRAAARLEEIMSHYQDAYLTAEDAGRARADKAKACASAIDTRLKQLRGQLEALQSQ